MLAVCFADFPAIEYTDDSTPNAGNRAIHSLNLLEIRICFAAGWNWHPFPLLDESIRIPHTSL